VIRKASIKDRYVSVSMALRRGRDRSITRRMGKNLQRTPGRGKRPWKTGNLIGWERGAGGLEMNVDKGAQH